MSEPAAAAVSLEQQAFFDAHCWRFGDTLQYVRLPGEAWGEREIETC